jgi:hypothetical protein
MDLTDAERRDAARFAADVWRHEYKRRRRRPQPHEVVVSAYAAAREILDTYVGDRVLFLGGPRALRGALAVITSGGAKVSAPLADRAEAAIKYLEQAGDNPTAKPASIVVDRRMVELMAQTYHRDREVNDCDVGRKLGLSHTSVRDRRLARSARILAQLHADCRDIWNAKLRPVVEKPIRNNDDSSALLLAA